MIVATNDRPTDFDLDYIRRFSGFVYVELQQRAAIVAIIPKRLSPYDECKDKARGFCERDCAKNVFECGAGKHRLFVQPLGCRKWNGINDSCSR